MLALIFLAGAVGSADAAGVADAAGLVATVYVHNLRRICYPWHPCGIREPGRDDEPVIVHAFAVTRQPTLSRSPDSIPFVFEYGVVAPLTSMSMSRKYEIHIMRNEVYIFGMVADADAVCIGRAIRCKAGQP